MGTGAGPGGGQWRAEAVTRGAARPMGAAVAGGTRPARAARGGAEAGGR